MDREHVQSEERTIIVLWDILSSTVPGDRESNIEDIVILFSATHRQHFTNIQTDVCIFYIIDV